MLLQLQSKIRLGKHYKNDTTTVLIKTLLDFTYSINKCDIANVFLFVVISEVFHK